MTLKKDLKIEIKYPSYLKDKVSPISESTVFKIFQSFADDKTSTYEQRACSCIGTHFLDKSLVFHGDLRMSVLNLNLWKAETVDSINDQYYLYWMRWVYEGEGLRTFLGGKPIIIFVQSYRIQKCNACIYSCLCGSHLESVQEGKGEIRYHFRQHSVCLQS